MRRIAVIAAAALTTIGLSVPAAQARSAAAGCPSGSVCFYSGADRTGSIVCQTPASTTITCSAYVRSAFNNGVVDPGKSDVWISFTEGASCVPRTKYRNIVASKGSVTTLWGSCG